MDISKFDFRKHGLRKIDTIFIRADWKHKISQFPIHYTRLKKHAAQKFGSQHSMELIYNENIFCFYIIIIFVTIEN